jgi:acid phosphatase (class A)
MKPVIIVLLSVLAFSQVNAQDIEPAGIFIDADVIGPFPALGSKEEKEDIATLLYYQNTRTQKECELAGLEADANLKSFYGSLLADHELKVLQKKLRWITVKTGLTILRYKEKYDRPRPYLSHPEIKPCIELEGSDAYPSGHATLARVYGRILASLFPERAELIKKRNDQIALNRVLGGVHHPTDIVAGSKLGDAIAYEYLVDGGIDQDKN